MAEYQRFASTRGDPDQLYRDHYGASVVGLVFRLADWYLRGRQPKVAKRFPVGAVERPDEHKFTRRNPFPTNTGQLS